MFMLDNGGSATFLGSSITLPVERKFGDLDGVRRYLREVRAREWGYPQTPEPRVRLRKGQHRAHWSDDVIALPDGIGQAGWAMREVVVLHEYAHHVTWHVHGSRGHGGEFQQVYSGLLEDAIGPEAALVFRASL